MINKKMCKRCKKDLPHSEFYKHPQMVGGLLNFCKSCKRGEAREGQVKFAARIQTYEKKRAVLPHRVKLREDYVKTERGKERSSAAKKSWINRNPEARFAHSEVRKALARGDLVKEPCRVCGKTRVHAHHDDYSKPLKVEWLCAFHHRKHHEA